MLKMHKKEEEIYEGYLLTLWSMKLTKVIWLAGRSTPTQRRMLLEVISERKRNFN